MINRVFKPRKNVSCGNSLGDYLCRKLSSDILRDINFFRDVNINYNCVLLSKNIFDMIEIPQSLIMGFIDDFDYMKYAFHISTVIVFVDKTDLLSVTEYTLFESNDLENVISQLKIHVRNKNIENILGG